MHKEAKGADTCDLAFRTFRVSVFVFGLTPLY